MQCVEARRQADTFYRLHAGSQPLVLVNARDAGSARLLENAGSRAIAATSAGMAWSLGYADGEHVPVGEFIDAMSSEMISVAEIDSLFVSPLQLQTEEG